jgi:hypothetical protein
MANEPTLNRTEKFRTQLWFRPMSFKYDLQGNYSKLMYRFRWYFRVDIIDNGPRISLRVREGKEFREYQCYTIPALSITNSSDRGSFAAGTFGDISLLPYLQGLCGYRVFSTTVARKLTILLLAPRSKGILHHLLHTSPPSGDIVS